MSTPRSLSAGILLVVSMLCSAPPAPAQQPTGTLSLKSLAQARVDHLPPGELWWRIEQFDSVAGARSAAGPWTLVAEADGKVWSFTLGPAGGRSPAARPVAEVGPIPRVEASHYLLRINDASGPPGAETAVHSHPGSEAFFVLAGEQSIRSPAGTVRIPAGRSEAGRGADQPMQVSSSGGTDLHALVMFVVDADRPFSTPAKWP